ncbi:MAG TPA: hypothetical protein VHX65_18185 [Pirellulales bacterium]|nr:hypothetical protein [Pirellulales bacterium]
MRIQPIGRWLRQPMLLALAVLAALNFAGGVAFGGGPSDGSSSNFTGPDAIAIASATPPAGGSPGSSNPSGATMATAAKAATPRGPRIDGGQINGHWREGTRLIDQLGMFKIAGDRVSFTSLDGTLHFDCLENLCGQRIARTVSDSPETLFWTVTGELTEFRGTNFLLLSQATLKPHLPRTAAAP